MARNKKSIGLLDDLNALELSKIGLTFAVIGDIIGFLAILKAEEEAAVATSKKEEWLSP
ncbi:hypothetical protein [Gorillibacterium massiliense]|uniref:hypothetical protein n=1 Tax=Gorillibacterium massiliense TaxID=1280390 RepID=UPI0004B32355|nr:hypothetical protein [Gorillibacterium massiliense]